MEELKQWYLTMPHDMQTYWALAMVGSVIFAVQMLLTIIGVDGSDADVDFSMDTSGSMDGDTTDFGGLSIFSIRNFVNFMLGVGWGGVCFAPVISNGFLLAVVAIIVGVAFVAMFFVIRKQTKKLEKNGAFRLDRCVGQTAQVYLRIPAARSGQGKIQISQGGSVHEINAMTDNEEMIPTGGRVTVKAIIDESTLLVGF